MNRTDLGMQNSIRRFKIKITGITSLSDGWKGAVVGLWIVTTLLWILQGYKMFASRGFLNFIIGTSLTYIFIIALIAFLLLILWLFRKIPLPAAGIIGGALLLLSLSLINTYAIAATFLVPVIIIVVFTLFGAFLYKVIRGYYKESKIYKKISIWGLIILLMVVISGGLYCGFTTLGQGTEMVDAKKASTFSEAYPSTDNPGNEGEYKVNITTYGSGTDLRYKEFGKDTGIVTNSVDGTAFIKGWSYLRKNYLGFGPDKLPVNGTVWYPEGNGSFPLVLMLHGNHTMPERSDLGYEYLGKLLASRGYIFASIDENFLNSSPYDDMLVFNGLRDETDARAYVLLEHLRAFDNFNNTNNNPFYNRVDMNNISLIGHSRGGEAVAVAAVFNRLKTYPNNGSVKFNYNYNIRSVVAIAPVDGNSRPTGKNIELKDVNYLVIHGSDDMDVSSFMGLKQYKRVSFSPDRDNYKASVYIYGANHGQFNNDWGKQDAVGIGGYSFFNIGNLMSESDQNMIAKVLISGFLDSTIKNKTEYRNIFEDIRFAQKWLPDTIYINDYYDSKTTTICSYDEDGDINTADYPGCSINGQNFSLWAEKRIKQKNSEMSNNSAYLSWNSEKDSAIPAYTIEISNLDGMLNGNSTLVFSLADYDKNNHEPIDLSISVADNNGNTAVLPLSHFQPLQYRLHSKIYKLGFLSPGLESEAVFQKYIFELKEFKGVNQSFIPEKLAQVSFIFDKTKKGTVLLDDIGIN